MEAKEFRRATSLGGIKLISLNGVLNEKKAPSDFIFTDLDDLPDELSVPMGEFITPGGFLPIVDTPYLLPKDGERGEVCCTKTGSLYLCIGDDTWVFFCSVSGVL